MNMGAMFWFHASHSCTGWPITELPCCGCWATGWEVLASVCPGVRAWKCSYQHCISKMTAPLLMWGGYRPQQLLADKYLACVSS